MPDPEIHDARDVRTAPTTGPSTEEGAAATDHPGGCSDRGEDGRLPVARTAERLEVPTPGSVSTLPDPEWYGPSLVGGGEEDTAGRVDVEDPGAASDRELVGRYDRYFERWARTGEVRPGEVVAAVALWDEIRDRAAAEQPPCPECGGRTWTRERAATRCGTCGYRAEDQLGADVAAARARILAEVRPDGGDGRPSRADA